jgi:hypothetical protein
MPILPGTSALKTWTGEYDFAVHGGAQSTIVLRSTDGPIPAGSVIISGYVDVETAAASATGTIAINSEAAGDIVAATGQASWTLGRKSIIPAGTGAASVKTTADRNPAITIATAAYTAGKFKLVLFYR